MRSSSELPPAVLRILLDDVPYRREKFEDKPEPSQLIGAIENAVRANLEMFIGVLESENLLDGWTSGGKLAVSVKSRLENPDFRFGVSRVLRTLVHERVPITDACTLLPALTDSELNPSELPATLKAVRLALKRQLPGNQSENRILQVPAEIEQKFAAGLQTEGADYRLVPEVAHGLINDLAKLLDGDGASAIVVREPALRPLFERLIEGRFPGIAVLSAEELLAGAGEPQPSEG